MKTIILVSFMCILSITSIINAQDNYCEILKYSLLFYKAQRAGRLPDNDIPWRGNSVLKDTYNNQFDNNGDGILSKGYFDAGDGVKFGFPMAYSMTMLGWVYITYKDNIINCGLDSLYKEVLRWGSDYNIAAHVEDNVFVGQIGAGKLDHEFWVSPEDYTYYREVFKVDSSNPGTDLVMEAAASLAVTSMVFANSDTSYSSKCLSHAKALYTFAKSSQQKTYSSSIPDAKQFYGSTGFNDEIAWASIWLYKATNDQSYLNTAVTYGDYNDVMYANEISWDNKGVAVNLLLYQIKQELKYKTNLEKALNHWKKDNGGIPYTPGGLAYLRNWGVCRYAMTMAMVAAMYGQPNDSYTAFAKSQLNYVLGNNPKGYSFVVGWGNKYPNNIHHRASHHPTYGTKEIPTENTYILYGALVGGPEADDSFKNDRINHTQSEVALDYNVGLVGTLAAYSSSSNPATNYNPYSGSSLNNSSDSESNTNSNSNLNSHSNSNINPPDSNSDSSLGSDSDVINSSVSIHQLSSFVLLICYLLINVLL